MSALIEVISQRVGPVASDAQHRSGDIRYTRVSKTERSVWDDRTIDAAGSVGVGEVNLSVTSVMTSLR